MLYVKHFYWQYFLFLFQGTKDEYEVDRKVTLEELILYYDQTSSSLNDYIDDRKRTLLHKSSMSGDSKVVKYLVERGANIDARDDQNWTPLHWAIREGNFDVCKYLIKSGANTNVRTHSGWTFRHLATVYERTDILQYLPDTDEVTEENAVKDQTLYQIPSGNVKVIDEKKKWKKLWILMFFCKNIVACL
jgi:hypothetical protein